MDKKPIEEIQEIEAPTQKMRKHVISFPKKLDEKVRKECIKSVSMIFTNNFREAEKNLEQLYVKIRKEEDLLSDNQRFHKGTVLYWWGFSLLFQEEQKKVSAGYEKLLLAYIEDLLDYPTFRKAELAPASKALLKNPAMGKPLLNIVQHRVNQLFTNKIVPKNPQKVLEPLTLETNEVLEKPIDITFTQIKPAIQEWLKKCGEKEKRVFVGGNYLNIAVLRLIETTVNNFDFIPIMPINFPETSKASHEKWIHDISMEVLKECSYAIFEVTFSNGHLMEIERAKDFNLKTILVYQTTKHGKKPTVTSMLLTTTFEKKGYRNFDELKPIIYSFLS